ncbi:NAD-dependent epimerase/dehydratase family protein [Faecalicatena contorta]|uniref:Nucleoside-diphosphate-sugar epimerase n=1 Tax=Faecalicatena contorta TaxID=39482 RepID=A0A315ZWG8_9FIRM|nr:NAD-dependent epimerase/dehydratase family protein [Faecalicatena contorta]PWJ49986.1 nucleoside-diphosphate-sugar epimerase [Faecalicatena contorta]SUQ14107.1 Nucleoside-diphosphate-sugar epimerase [Faecalicatena contorta]
MKILYIGSGDYLAAGIMEKLAKEEHELFLMSDEDIKTEGRRAYQHKFFKISDNPKIIDDIFASANPDVAVFTGLTYIDKDWNQGKGDYYSLLSTVLESSAKFEVGQFVYFSSLDVYGNQAADDDSGACGLSPRTKRGFYHAQGEVMVEMYRVKYSMCCTILRCADVFSNKHIIGSGEFLGCMAEEVREQEHIVVKKDKFLQPLYIADVAEALKRVLDTKVNAVYHLCSSYAFKKSEIYERLARSQGLERDIIVEQEADEGLRAENKKLKSQQEWTDFWRLDNMLNSNDIQFTAREVKEQKRRRKENKVSEVRRTIENFIVFGVFLLMFHFTSEHALFSKIDWFLIYILLISLFFGIKQSALAVILSSVAYLSYQKVNLREITNFASYVQYILMIVEFIFFGVVVAYVVDFIKEELRIRTQDLQFMKAEYEELKEINKDNVFIKNEYEKRILESKTGLPRLYSMLSSLNVLEPERILMQVIQVVGELLNTDTVAVYKVSQKSSYLRLAASMNQESTMGGNSWNLAQYPKIQEALKSNDIYEGDVWNGEPAVVAAIRNKEECIALIVVKKLSMERMTLYHMNILRTLDSMIAEAMNRALEFENVVQDSRYIDNTNILNTEEFKKMIEIADEKSQKNLAPYSILRVGLPTDKAYPIVKKLLREVDYVGINEQGILYVLLNNASAKDARFVIKRFEEQGVPAQLIDEY